MCPPETSSKKSKDVEVSDAGVSFRWQPDEETLLAKCYVAVSEERNVGRSQAKDTFWYRVLNEFNSGESELDVMKQARAAYRDENKNTPQEEAWELLHANNDDARTSAYKVDNMVRKPKPWAYGNSPLSLRELQQMRNEFWHNAIRAGGRREIWEALRAVTEGNLLNAQKIIEDKNIRLGNQDMSVCYDDNGTRYNLPLYVLSEPTNMEHRVLNHAFAIALLRITLILH
nr:hypothetical protein [Tanacetum cinerariifolium]